MYLHSCTWILEPRGHGESTYLQGQILGWELKKEEESKQQYVKFVKSSSDPIRGGGNSEPSLIVWPRRDFIGPCLVQWLSGYQFFRVCWSTLQELIILQFPTYRTGPDNPGQINWPRVWDKSLNIHRTTPSKSLTFTICLVSLKIGSLQTDFVDPFSINIPHGPP